MEDKEHERRYLVIIRGDNVAETASAVKIAMKILGQLSRGGAHLAFSSADGAFAGFFVKIDKPARVIRAALEPASTYKDRGFVLVLELGEEWTGIGNSAGWRWLQH